MAWVRSVFPLVADAPVGLSVADQLVHGPMQRARSAIRVESSALAALCADLERKVLTETKAREQALWDALASDDLPFPDQPSWIKGAVAGTVTLHTQCSAADVMAAGCRATVGAASECPVSMLMAGMVR